MARIALFLLFFFAGALRAQPVGPDWTAPLPAAPAAERPYAYNGRVWMVLEDNRLHSVELETGAAPRTTMLEGGPSVRVCTSEGRVWLLGADGMLRGHGLQPGRSLVTAELPPGAWSDVRPAGPWMLVVGENALCLVDRESGRVLAPEPLPGRPSAPAAISSLRVALLVETARGSELLLFPLGDSGLSSPARVRLETSANLVSLATGHVYVSDTEGNLTAYRLREQGRGGVRRIWRRRMGGPLSTAVLEHAGRLFVVSYDNWLRVLNPGDGALLARVRLDRRIHAEPLVLGADSLVVQPAGAAYLRELHPESGREGRSWWSGADWQRFRGSPAADSRRRWFVATLGPWQWQLAGYRNEAVVLPRTGSPGATSPAEGTPAPTSGEEASPGSERQDGATD